jgi:hypothetical protein
LEVVEEQKELESNSTSSSRLHVSKAQKSQQHAKRERDKHTNKQWSKNRKKVELNPISSLCFHTS